MVYRTSHGLKWQISWAEPSIPGHISAIPSSSKLLKAQGGKKNKLSNLGYYWTIFRPV